jgi:hypothetical protein
MRNLLPESSPTTLPADPDADGALARALHEPAGQVDRALKEVAAQFPAFSAAWASLAELAMTDGEPVIAYALARTGYHRGLDQLRRAGWRGAGPVPWNHEPNQGFLRSLRMLGLAAAAIGEADEAARCAQFLKDCDPVAGDAFSG